MKILILQQKLDPNLSEFISTQLRQNCLNYKELLETTIQELPQQPSSYSNSASGYGSSSAALEEAAPGAGLLLVMHPLLLSLLL